VGDDRWLDVITAHATANTFIVSGDQHWSAILRLVYGELLPYVLYEFQTTPLAARVHRVSAQADETVLALDDEHRVFGVFDVDTRVDPPHLEFTLCAVGQACAPHAEPVPVPPVAGTTVPYSVRFVGGPRGVSLASEP
jgi:hypothetical protein